MNAYKARFSHASMCRVQFGKADLGQADFDGTNLGGAHMADVVDMTGVDLTGALPPTDPERAPPPATGFQDRTAQGQER